MCIHCQWQTLTNCWNFLGTHGNVHAKARDATYPTPAAPFHYGDCLECTLNCFQVPSAGPAHTASLTTLIGCLHFHDPRSHSLAGLFLTPLGKLLNKSLSYKLSHQSWFLGTQPETCTSHLTNIVRTKMKLS